MPQSGNHGRNNEPVAVAPAPASPPASGIDASISVTPRQSNLAFTSPRSAVQPSPSIKELVVDKELAPADAAPTPVATQHAATPEPAPEVATTPPEIISASEQETDEELIIGNENFASLNRNSAFDAEPVATPNNIPTPLETIPIEEKTFEEVWHEAFDNVYKSVYTVHGLKEVIPTFNDGIASFTVKNEFQKEQVLGKTREMIHYFKHHSNIILEKIAIEIGEEESQPMQKQYLDEADKIRILKETNPELIDFVKVLGLQIEE